MHLPVVRVSLCDARRQAPVELASRRAAHTRIIATSVAHDAGGRQGEFKANRGPVARQCGGRQKAFWPQAEERHMLLQQRVTWGAAFALFPLFPLAPEVAVIAVVACQERRYPLFRLLGDQ